MMTTKYLAAAELVQEFHPRGVVFQKQLIDDSESIVDVTEISSEIYLANSETGASSQLKDLMIDIYNSQFIDMYDKAIEEHDEFDPAIKLYILLEKYRITYSVYLQLKLQGK